MDKLIVTAAITGGASPEGNPYLPKTPMEQVQAILECYNAGAAVVHINDRNPHTGKGEHKAEWFEQAIVRIAKELGREIATPEEAREILGLPK